MKLSVIIVNYNVRYFLEQALLSVQRASDGIELEVFVVDNNSRDDSVAMVREKFPEVQLIENQDNPGFAKANNQAIRIAKGEYILLLNPDTVVEEDTFQKCISFMDTHPDAGGLGVRMIDGSGKFLPESKRGFPSPWVSFCKTFGLSKIFPKSPVFNRYHLGYLPQFETHEVDVLAGAFMMLRKSVLDEIGLLDESFFMYGEDIDLSYRIVLAGYKNYYLPETSIIHYKGESTRKGSLNYVRVFYKAMIIFAKKHFTGKGAWMFVLMLQFAIYFRAFLTLLNNIINKLWLPIVDTGLMLSGMLLLKNFWAKYYFRNPDYFEHPEIYYFNIPLYIIIWLSAIYLSGGYDKSSNIRRIIRGVLIGTLVLAAVYGIFPTEYRFFRALILPGAVWAIFATVALRVFLHFLKYKNFNIGREKKKNLAIVGSIEESERVLKLLQQADVQHNFIGAIATNEETDESNFLGSISVLNDLVHIYRIEEIIFCSSDVKSRQIMHWMTELGPSVNYKILPKESFSIIGSSSKDSPGELYTVDISFAIANPMNRRNKRFIDLSLCLLLLPILPFLLLLINNRIQFIKNGYKVLIKKKSWVGYSSKNTLSNDLPKILPGILSPLDKLKLKNVDTKTINRLNFLYAKDYTTSDDFEIIVRGWRNLGRG